GDDVPRERDADRHGDARAGPREREGDRSGAGHGVDLRGVERLYGEGRGQADCGAADPVGAVAVDDRLDVRADDVLGPDAGAGEADRSEEHTSELQSRVELV